MDNLKISTRLVLMTGLLSAMLVVIGGIGLFGISKSNAALQAVYERHLVAVGKLDTIMRALLSNRLAIAAGIISPTQEQIAASVSQFESNRATITKAWDDYSAIAKTAEEEKLAASFAERRARFLQEGLVPALAALRANDVREAVRITVQKIRPLFAPVNETVDELIKLGLENSKREYEAAVARYQAIRAAAIASILIGIALAAAFGMLLVRGIGRALGHAADVSNAVSRGDLTAPIHVEGKNEVTQLLRAMSAMKDNLARVVAQVRTGVDSVTIASGQIAAGNQDLSSRTEEQASSLEETAASMEQLTSTVKISADNAKQANQLAVSASEAAFRGGQVVGQVVTTMAEIAASSMKMAEIINVIDGIAFQTNILALNAAVEAARAGEQGRGFAVVASEVRNLAQRSAQAAREIKGMIQDSVRKVDAGGKLVSDAGGSMREIVDQVKRVSDLVGEITSAAVEQSSGIGQVNEAVAQMDKVTQQNASLVEESAAAAASLKEQADRLAEVVAIFQLSGLEARQVVTQVRAGAHAAKPAKRVEARPAADPAGSEQCRAVPTADTDKKDWEEF